MIQRPVAHGSPRSANRQFATVKQISRTVAILGSLVHQLKSTTKKLTWKYIALLSENVKRNEQS